MYGGPTRCQTPSVQISSSHNHLRPFAAPWIAARQASLSITNSQRTPKLMCIESVMSSNHLILCHPLLLLLPISPSINIFSNESILRMRWPKYWSFSFSISPSNEHPGLVSFRMDWLDLLAVQGTLKSLLHHTVAIGGIKDRAKTLCKWAWGVQHIFTSILPNGLSSAYETVVLGVIWITSLEFHIKK